MLPVVLVKVVQIAAGVAVGNLASEVVDKTVVGVKKGVKKVVEVKKEKKGAQ